MLRNAETLAAANWVSRILPKLKRLLRSLPLTGEPALWGRRYSGQEAAGRVSIAFTIWASGAAGAQAGAWPQPPGTTEIIATAAAKRYDSRPEEEFDIYAEHGVNKTWTAIAGVRGWSRLESGRTFSQVGVRWKLTPILGAEVASEARVLHGRDWNECGGWGLESRALAG